MGEIIHLNCGTLVVEGYPTVVCHCVALRDGDHVVLVDTGIGLLDAADPVGRIGAELIDGAGFRFNEHDTAARRLEAIGIAPSDVTDIVLTHADPDHTGGLADFPQTRVHVWHEEFAAVRAEAPRYIQSHFAHGPDWEVHERADERWYGLPACGIPHAGETRVQHVRQPGHPHGLLHAGDAYYLRAELADPEHPVSGLAAARADDDAARVASLGHLRRIAAEEGNDVSMVCYHDIEELPGGLDFGPR